MRTMRTLGLTLAALVAMVLLGATPGLAETPTQLCNVHDTSDPENPQLECPEGEGTASVHMTLAEGTVGKWAGNLAVILCLGILVEANPLELGTPQEVHITESLSFTGCGTKSTHSNCAATVEILPLASLLKTGLDQGSVTAEEGRIRFQCPEIGIDCKIDAEGLSFSIGAQHLTANKTPIKELGFKFSCPGEGTLSGLLKTLENSYILGEPGELPPATTSLCEIHSATCAEEDQVKNLHLALAEGTVAELSSSSATVLCLGALVEATPLALGTSQAVHTSALSLTGCGTGSGHNDCSVTIEELPLADLLRIGLDEGSVTVENGRAKLQCPGLGIDCKYDTEGLEFSAGSQHLTASEAPVTELGGKSLCPEEGKLSGLLETVHASTSFTELCKTHAAEKCAEKDQVKSLHVVTTKPPVLYNTIANIECESSLGMATVLAPAEAQKLDVTELTWKGCHTQGAADNCTLSTKALPTLDLKQTALNFGEATTLGLKVGVDCTILGLIELDCVYGSDVALQVEGALHQAGTGHGMLTASKAVLKKLEGGGHCPESVKWDALYEPLEHAYIASWSSPLSPEDAYILR